MKNLNYFPFERNRYYYGKLLTEQDFQQEQRYMNDKRRFVNRFLFGTGVVAGLKVVAVGEKSISLEAGVALDYCGRELVVETPLNRNLSMIDGFESAESEKKGYLYLCMEYDERAAAPAPDLTGLHAFENGSTADRVQEGYHLYLTGEEPELSALAPEALYEERRLLCAHDGLFVRQILPKAAESGQDFAVTIELENLGATRQVGLKLEEALDGLVCGEARSLSLEETWILERNERVQKQFTLRVLGLSDGRASLALKAENLTLSVSGREVHAKEDQQFYLPVLREALWEQAGRRMIDEHMELVRRYNHKQGIYLARIELIKTGGVYLIGRIDQNPFGQYVEHAALLSGYLRWLRRDVMALQTRVDAALKDKGQTGRTDVLSGAGHTASTAQQASGVVSLDLGLGGKRGQRYFSEEIFHGLGLGDVAVTLSIEEEQLSYSGSGEIFQEMQIKAELAAKVDRARGCLVIGARLLEPTAERGLKVRWRAQLAQQARETEEKQPRLIIRPNMLQLRVREHYYLEAEAVNMHNPSVRWSVKTKDGGSITQDGCYTAPNLAGVYEVRAQSEEDASIEAALFIIVRA